MKRLWTLFFALFLIFCIYAVEENPAEVVENPYDHLLCREVNYGGGHHNTKQRKFLVLSGGGAGIGNFLIFYPAAYYFAALTGRVRENLHSLDLWMTLFFSVRRIS